MANVTVLNNHAVAGFASKDLALIKRTVAADTTDDEFNLFISYCTALQLDPRRRQIYALVYNKDKPTKRKMTIIVGIDGFRSIAARTGDYRPDEDEPSYEIDPKLVSPHNPAGLVKASVRVHKFSHNSWHKVTASAYWDEYAPLREDWSETTNKPDGTWPDGNPKYKKVPVEGATKILTLDGSGNWAKMPRLMLAKVAEALALRKAWPDNFSGVYAQEELDQAIVAEMLPAEAAAEGAMEERMARIGGRNNILLDMLDGSPLAPVDVGKFADRVMAFLAAHKDEPSQIGLFTSRNRHGLQQFWSYSPGDALTLKKEIEKAVSAAGEVA